MSCLVSSHRPAPVTSIRPVCSRHVIGYRPGGSQAPPRERATPASVGRWLARPLLAATATATATAHTRSPSPSPSHARAHAHAHAHALVPCSQRARATVEQKQRLSAGAPPGSSLAFRSIRRLTAVAPVSVAGAVPVPVPGLAAAAAARRPSTAAVSRYFSLAGDAVAQAGGLEEEASLSQPLGAGHPRQNLVLPASLPACQPASPFVPLACSSKGCCC